MAELLEKFEAWLKQQPGWVFILTLPRQQRRAAMKELANRLYMVPQMDGVNTVNRQMKRKTAKTLGHAVRTGQLTGELRTALATVAKEAAGEGDDSTTYEEDVHPFAGIVPSAPEAVVEDPEVEELTEAEEPEASVEEPTATK